MNIIIKNIKVFIKRQSIIETIYAVYSSSTKYVNSLNLKHCKVFITFLKKSWFEDDRKNPITESLNKSEIVYSYFIVIKINDSILFLLCILISYLKSEI